MIALIENMRKMMGWCPNTSTIKYKGSMHFDTPQMNAAVIPHKNILAVKPNDIIANAIVNPTTNTIWHLLSKSTLFNYILHSLSTSTYKIFV